MKKFSRLISKLSYVASIYSNFLKIYLKASTACYEPRVRKKLLLLVTQLRYTDLKKPLLDVTSVNYKIL